jgi:hypothetical protein
LVLSLNGAKHSGTAPGPATSSGPAACATPDSASTPAAVRLVIQVVT